MEKRRLSFRSLGARPRSRGGLAAAPSRLRQLQGQLLVVDYLTVARVEAVAEAAGGA